MKELVILSMKKTKEEKNIFLITMEENLLYYLFPFVINVVVMLFVHIILNKVLLHVINVLQDFVQDA